MEKMEEMPADRVVIGLDLDALAVVREMIPVEKHRGDRGEKVVGDVAGSGFLVVVVLGKAATKC